MKQKKWNEAEEKCLKAITIDSTFTLAYYRLAHLQARLFGEEYLGNEKMQTAHGLIEGLPEKYRYLVRAQQARFEQGFEASIVILREMEQYYPNDEEMLYNMGYWSYWAGKFTVAAEYLEKFLKQDPTNEPAIQRLTEAYEQLGLYEKMNELAKRYIVVARSLQSYTMLAISYMNLNNNELAIQTLEQACPFFSEDYRIVDLIANFYMFQEKYEKVETELKTLIHESQPPEAKQRGQESLANLNLYHGMYRVVLKYRENKIKSLWKSKDTTWSAIQQFDKANLFIWDWQDSRVAIQEVEKSLALGDRMDSPFFWMRVAVFYLFSGKHADADSIAQSISQTPSLDWFHEYISPIKECLNQKCNKIQLVADYPIIRGGYRHHRIFLLYLLAKCQFEKGEFNKAIEYLDKLRTIYTNYLGVRAVIYPKSLYLSGRIFESRGDIKRAKEHYEKFLVLWKDADEDLPELIDSKTRFEKLK